MSNIIYFNILLIFTITLILYKLSGEHQNVKNFTPLILFIDLQ